MQQIDHQTFKSFTCIHFERIAEMAQSSHKEPTV